MATTSCELSVHPACAQPAALPASLAAASGRHRWWPAACRRIAAGSFAAASRLPLLFSGLFRAGKQ